MCFIEKYLENYAIGGSTSLELIIVSEFINHEKLMTNMTIALVAF